MKSTVTSLCVLALAAAACAADTAEDSSKSRAFSTTTSDFGKTVERVLARALGAPEPRFAGVGSAITDLLSGIPASLSSLESVLIVAAPIVAVVGLVIGIVALTKVGALYSHLGLSAYDTVKEAISLGLPDFGLPGRGYPAEGEYAGPGHYDPTQYPYHEEDHHAAAAAGGSSYTSYVSRRTGTTDSQQQQTAESRLSQRVPAASQPIRWS